MNPLKNPENSHIIDNVLVDDIFFQVSQYFLFSSKHHIQYNKITIDSKYSTLTRKFPRRHQAETRELGQQKDNW